MNRALITATLFSLSALVSSHGVTAPVEATVPAIKIHQPGELVVDANLALQYLKEGNERYVKNQGMPRNTNDADRNVLKDGQKPFAVVITCSDSRVAPEVYFDQKMGDLFVIRNAGNFADTTALGSLEFAVEHLKAPLVVVVGHTQCGAIKGTMAADAKYSHNLQKVVDTIRPNIKNSKELPVATKNNVDSNVKIVSDNAVVKKMGAKVVGANYDIATGVVDFY